MLGYVVADGRGEADILLDEVARRLMETGISLAGAVQVNSENGPAKKCHMDLHILSMSEVTRISRDLGALSQGCRLDPEGLEHAVGLVAAALARGPDLLIINKFGKQELEGRGFRPLIGEALAAGIPVVVAVNRGNLDGFKAFIEDMGAPLPPRVEDVVNWCLAQCETGVFQLDQVPHG